MAFEGLTERLKATFKKISGKGRINQSDLDNAMREIRTALLEADVSLKVTRQITRRVSDEALGAHVLDSITPDQQIIKIVDDELIKVMGDEASELNKSKHIPTIVLMVGLQGAGKTTAVGKLARRLVKENNARPLLIAADVYRPAAIDQLKTLGETLKVPVYDEGTDVDPVEIVKNGLDLARKNNNDYVFIDTAGRLTIDEQLMDELKKIKELSQPTEILLVVDAMTGQTAVDVANDFNDALGITGVVLTKLDGDTRGGAALSIRYDTGVPIKFVGTGEKLSDLDVFYPDRMASRILGMGDILSLVDKAQEQYNEQQAQELARKIQENNFDLDDFIEQMDQVQQMGPMDELVKMIPGLSDMPGAANIQFGDKDFAHMRAIVSSMTQEERMNADVLTPKRRRRIAAGSGRDVMEVNRLIKQYKQTSTLMNKMQKGNMGAMDQMFAGQGVKGKLGKMAMNSMIKKNKKKKAKRLKKVKRFKTK
ncbi:signal recognition particle protein [Xylocopilactobacillus apicola]|uniref:Signal recognition particle protein n=1 Tax=Xylocopilactobacillus apicola TaxID=2932184 RepID=A0AAU9CW10_9LACO|nr:signal recognition particle protein [Xylocopilactobacillus apicola]BDR58177.1 signal recognition particle protein [Xylocopilactobacillus apicola]